MNDRPALRRRHVLRAGALISAVTMAGCAGGGGNPTPDDEVENADDPADDREEPVEMDEEIKLWHFAADVEYWAWYPADQDLWSRSATPYDFEEGGGRWMARPTEDGSVRCRVENDDPPGNAGFYVPLGEIGQVERVTIDSETVQSEGDDAQMLLVALYFDADGDGEYFQWETRDDREAFAGLGADLEGIRLFPAGDSVTIDADTMLDWIPPMEEKLVSFGDVTRGGIDGVTPATKAAVKVSVVGSGEGNAEEAIVHDVTVERPEPIEVPPESWSMFRHDIINTGHNTDAAGPTETVTPRWEFVTDGSVRSSPAVIDGTVYVGSDDGSLYAIDAETGAERWAADTDGPIRSSPAVLGETVYVGSDDHAVYAFDTSSGETRWTFETDDKVRSSPMVSDGWDYVEGNIPLAIGSNDGSVYLLTAVTGELYREFETDGPVIGSPIHPAQETTRGPINLWFMWGSTDGGFYRWKIEREREVGHEIGPNSTDLGAPIYASVAGPMGRHFAGDDDGTLHGEVTNPDRWAFETGGPIRSSPTLDTTLMDMVFVGSWDGSVYAVNTPSGELEWAFETGDRVNSSPALVDGTLYVGSDDGRVYALDAEQGEKQWAFETAGAVMSSPAVVDGTVYVGSDDGSVYALEKT